MSFLETPRFPDDIAFGSVGGPSYDTRVIRYGAGYEQRNINWTYPLHKFNVAYGVKTNAQWESLVDMFHAVAGQAYGFRIKDHRDYKSCALASAIAATNQSIGTGDGTTVAFQLKKTYTKGANTRVRLIKKPVANTTLIAVAGVVQTAGWTVSTTTGIVTFSASNTKTITAATNAASAELTVGASHGFVINQSVHLSAMAGGTWSTVNGLRYLITSTTGTTITINLNSTGLGAYTASSGSAKNLPQSGEAITAGYEFDVPVRFAQDYLPASYHDRDMHGIDVMVEEYRL